MTRRQLVSGLRSLHEDAEVDNIRIVKRSGAVVVDYHQLKSFHLADKIHGQLIIAEPNPQPKTKKPKS